MNIQSTITLNNGVAIPVLGLGVFQTAQGSETQNAVSWALEAGYRHIDTAAIYHNEEDVGIAIAQSGIPRQDIFVTTKLWNDDHGYDKALKACDTSLNRLGLDYVDLYLIHWHASMKIRETWRALIRLREEGKCRAIGVSNFVPRQIEKIIKDSGVVPAVNQVEFHPFLYQKELLAYCRSKGIQIEAYSPLTRGKRLDHPVLNSVAQKYGKTPAQILIRWGLQHGLVVLPKSAHKERILSNADVFDFEIGEEDMQTLDGLNENLRLIRPRWSPIEWW